MYGEKHLRTEYQACNCHDAEHLMVFKWWKDDLEDKNLAMMYVEYHLQSWGFWRRVWCAIKYICGVRSKYGDFGEYVWSLQDVEEVIKKLNKFKNACEKTNK